MNFINFEEVKRQLSELTRFQHTAPSKIIDELESLNSQFESAVGMYSSQEFYTLASEILIALSISNFNLGNFPIVEVLAKKAVEKSRLAENPKNLATSINLRGLAAMRMSQFKEALLFFEDSKSIREGLDDSSGVGQVLINMGIVFRSISLYDQSVEQFEKAIPFFEKTYNKSGLALAYDNLGTTLLKMSKFSEAIEHFQSALQISQESDDKIGIGVTYLNIGLVYEKQRNYKKSLEYFELALGYFKENNDNHHLAIAYTNMANSYSNLNQYDKSRQCIELSNSLFEESNDILGITRNLGRLANIYEQNEEYSEALRLYAECYSLSKKHQFLSVQVQVIQTLIRLYHQVSLKQEFYEIPFPIISHSPEYFRTTYNLNKQQYSNYKVLSLQTSLLLLEYLKSLNSNQALEQNHYYYANYKYLVHKELQQFELALLYFEESMQLKEDITGKETAIRLATFEASRQLELLQKEREVTDSLLHKMLPGALVEQLKYSQTEIATYYEDVTIIFMDIVGFTKLSQLVSARELVKILGDIFSFCDGIADKHNIEKIKTIGDSYMAVGGATINNPIHHYSSIQMALEICEYMKGYFIKDVDFELQVRFGIHSGPVIGGVIGSKRPSFDIWGDSVNIASRLESRSEPNKINISGTLYERVKDMYMCSYRGKHSAKNIGDMEMYFVDKLID
jgi:class 3 adenylate cyclase